MVFYELKADDQLEILGRHLSIEPFASMEGEKTVKIKMMTLMASHYLAKAVRETDEKLREEVFREVRTFFNKSDKIEISEKSTFALKGYYYFYQNEIRQSSDYFENAKETDMSFVPSIVGRVDSSMNLGHFGVCQEEIRGGKRALQECTQNESEWSLPASFGSSPLLLHAR